MYMYTVVPLNVDVGHIAHTLIHVYQKCITRRGVYNHDLAKTCIYITI